MLGKGSYQPGLLKIISSLCLFIFSPRYCPAYQLLGQRPDVNLLQPNA